MGSLIASFIADEIAVIGILCFVVGGGAGFAICYFWKVL